MTIRDYNERIGKLDREREMYVSLMNTGVMSFVRFVNGNNLHMERDIDYMEARKALRGIFHANETMDRYYMCQGDLAVTYSYGEWDVAFYFSNAEEMLEKVSGGSCKIVQEEEIKDERRIVCEVKK